MPLSYAELEEFYEDLVSEARRRGVACAITSGMACVAFGVAAATLDCDLLCSPETAEELFRMLQETCLRDRLPNYRGHLTAPLDSRWLSGGWTSHFCWSPPNEEAYLDIFGIPPRGTSPWAAEFQGLYAGLHTVAEMKRTDRDKDWPFATALGLKLLETGDQRGWLHLFNLEVLRETLKLMPCPAEMIALRPVLSLLAEGDDRLEIALKAEIEFWHRLDQLRLKVYERALRPYMLAVKREALCDPPSSLAVQHGARLKLAGDLLPFNPLREYGIDRLIDETKGKTAEMLPSGALRWLPDASECFKFLSK